MKQTEKNKMEASMNAITSIAVNSRMCCVESIIESPDSYVVTLRQYGRYFKNLLYHVKIQHGSELHLNFVASCKPSSLSLSECIANFVVAVVTNQNSDGTDSIHSFLPADNHYGIIRG